MFHKLIKSTYITVPQNMYSHISLFIDWEKWGGTFHHTCDEIIIFIFLTSLFKQTTAVFSLSPPPSQ